MEIMKKNLCISLLFVIGTYSFGAPANSPINSPIVSPINSPINLPTVSPTATGIDIYGRYSQRRLNRDPFRTQDPRRFVPYNSLDNVNGRSGLNRLRSLLQRSTTSYYSLSRTPAALRNSDLTALGQTQLPLPEQRPNDPSFLDLNPQRPMSSQLTDIDISLSREMKLLELRDLYGDLPLEAGILNEPVRKANPDITDLLQKGRPAEPQTPQLPGEPFEQKKKLDNVKDGDVYDSLFDEIEQDQLTKQLEEKAAESKYSIKIPKIKPLPEPDHKKAAKIRGKHKTFDSLAKANTEDYIKIANKMLKAGKSYKAADACTLAMVWMPENAEAHLIKGLALFAAGEYMSASFFIQQAIELNKDYASEKIGLEEKIPDIDLIDNRLVEAKQWQRQTRSPEIAFLIAFINYQQGNVISASEIIEKAIEKMGDNAAVKALYEVIKAADRY